MLAAWPVVKTFKTLVVAPDTAGAFIWVFSDVGSALTTCGGAFLILGVGGLYLTRNTYGRWLQGKKLLVLAFPFAMALFVLGKGVVSAPLLVFLLCQSSNRPVEFPISEGTYWLLRVSVSVALLSVFFAVSYRYLYGTESRKSIDAHCWECGYELTGNSSGRCPECGWRVSKEQQAMIGGAEGQSN